MAAFMRRLRRRRPTPACEIPDWARRRAVAETSFVPWVDRALPLADRTVLEYGCGNGAVAAAFAPHVGRHIGLDIDEAAVAQGQELLAQEGVDASLRAAGLGDILGEVAALRGEIDVFLCYAVLEHMTVDERLELLALAQDVVRPDGAIVVVETPNRLLPWDYHTAQLPFYSQLPDDLAIRYRHHSPRTDFVTSIDAAAAEGDAALRESFTRWGRGMSYHELQLAFDDLPARTLATSWALELLPERNIHREELALQATLDDIDPTLPPSFSRYWLDIVIAATPQASPPLQLRPWELRTVGSPRCEYDRGGVVRMPDADAALAIELPEPSARLVVGAEGQGDHVDVTLVQRATGRTATARLDLGAHGIGYGECRFDAAHTGYELRLGGTGVVSFVGFDG